MTGRVLVIDDDRAIAQLTSIVLRAAGYEVEAAHDGYSGLERVRQMRPDVIVLDLRLPDIDGFEVAGLLGQDPELSSTPIIILSANVQEQARMRASAAGVAAFIAKPFEKQVVLSAVGDALAADPTVSTRRIP